MSKQIVFDLEKNSVLAAVCNARGSSVTMAKVSHQATNGERDLGQCVAAAASEIGAGKAEAVFVAARELVEVRTISVPRIEPDELPDVIRFQAQRQLANMGDNWTLDYVLLPEQPGQEMQTALVGAIAPTALAEISQVAERAGVQVSHVALRPIEIARYARASGKLGNGSSLVMSVCSGNADLLFLRRGQVVLVRGTKLPSEAEDVQAALSGELRRSLMAASPELGNEPIDSVLLIATPEIADRVQTALAEVVDAPISLVDPNSILSGAADGNEGLTQHSTSRLVGVAGAALLPSANKKETLDFANPKKRPPKKKNTFTYVLAAAAGLMLVLAGVSWWYSKNRSLDDELAMLEDDIESKKPLLDAANKKISQLNEVSSFLDGAPNFLDELTYISERMPPAEEVIMDGPTFSVLQDGTGQIRFPVVGKDADSISEFEQSLRDEYHTVTASDEGEILDPSNGYRWMAMETITIRDRGWKLLADASATKKPATEAADNAKATAAESAEESSDDTEASETPASDSGEDSAAPVEESPSTEPGTEEAQQPEEPATSAEGEDGESTKEETKLPVDKSKQAANGNEGSGGEVAVKDTLPTS